MKLIYILNKLNSQVFLISKFPFLSTNIMGAKKYKQILLFMCYLCMALLIFYFQSGFNCL